MIEGAAEIWLSNGICMVDEDLPRAASWRSRWWSLERWMEATMFRTAIFLYFLM